jgi:hypothetical protein
MLVCVAPVFLTGCVATNQIVPGYENRTSTQNFTIVDARPAVEKRTETLSFWTTSCDYGIARMGDDASEPPRLEILRQDIEKALGEKVANASMTVTHYTMYLNAGRQLRELNPYGHSLIGAIMTPTCSKEETKVGWYEASEIQNFNAPMIVEITAQFLGKEYSVRTVRSSDGTIVAPGGFRNADQVSSVYGAMEKANQALITQLKQ